jgi:hypothetical protein
MFYLHRQVGMKMEHTECSETSAYKIHTSGNYPEEIVQHLEHGENLKLRIELHLSRFIGKASHPEMPKKNPYV